MNLITQSEFDLIGQDVTISDSKNKEIIGINGKIIIETKNGPYFGPEKDRTRVEIG